MQLSYNGSYREGQALGVLVDICRHLLTYGDESWDMTERVRLQMQASEMRLLRKIKGVMMFDKHRKATIRGSLNIESLLLRI